MELPFRNSGEAIFKHRLLASPHLVDLTFFSKYLFFIRLLRHSSVQPCLRATTCDEKQGTEQVTYQNCSLSKFLVQLVKPRQASVLLQPIPGQHLQAWLDPAALNNATCELSSSLSSASYSSNFFPLGAKIATHGSEFAFRLFRNPGRMRASPL